MRRWLKRILLLLAAIFLPTALIIAERGSEALVVPYRRSVQPYHRTILTAQQEHGLEVLSFASADGTPGLLMLPSRAPGTARKARALRQELTDRQVLLPAFGDTIGTLVLLHGRNGRKEDHLPVAERFCAAGFACVSCDLPGHGDSPSAASTFGHNEKHQLAGLLTAARALHPLPTPVALFGYSQGGAIALQTAAQPGSDYFAVATIASFADLDSLVQDGARNLHPATRNLAGPCATLVRLGTRLRAGFDPARIRPEDCASRISAAVFVLHGAEDTFITPSHAQRIHAAVSHPDKHLAIVPAAAHNDVLAVGGNALFADLAAFYLRHLPR